MFRALPKLRRSISHAAPALPVQRGSRTVYLTARRATKPSKQQNTERRFCDKATKKDQGAAVEDGATKTEGTQGGKQIQISIIDQTTALDKGGVKLGIRDDIMASPTVGGKVYKATTYATQGLLAGFGVVLFGLIGYNLYGNMAKKTSPTAMLNMAMKRLHSHPQTEVNLGNPIKGKGEGHRGHRTENLTYRKSEDDPTTYTYTKFYVEGKKNDGVVHVEYADQELLYIICEIPRTGKNFALEDNRKEHNLKVKQLIKEQLQSTVLKNDTESARSGEGPVTLGGDSSSPSAGSTQEAPIELGGDASAMGSVPPPPSYTK